MRPLRLLALVLCAVSVTALALCLLTDWRDELFLTMALCAAAAANLIDRRDEKQSRKGDTNA